MVVAYNSNSGRRHLEIPEQSNKKEEQSRMALHVALGPPYLVKFLQTWGPESSVYGWDLSSGEVETGKIPGGYLPPTYPICWVPRAWLSLGFVIIIFSPSGPGILKFSLSKWRVLFWSAKQICQIRSLPHLSHVSWAQRHVCPAVQFPSAGLGSDYPLAVLMERGNWVPKASFTSANHNCPGELGSDSPS